jgi:amino acid transporter
VAGENTRAGHAVHATVGEHPSRRLGWFDGFVFSLALPVTLIPTLGYSIASLGTWLAVALWGVTILLGALASTAYAELAGMFPEKPGIALYAWEGWRSRFALVGPVASFGYWFAWSSGIAIIAGIAGNLVMAQWFPGQDWVWDVGAVDITFARLVAAGILVGVWAANVLGLRPTTWLAYASAAMLVVPLAAFMFLPFLSGDWSSSTFTGSDGGLRLAIVWLYIMCWTSLGIELCTTFTPEYRDGVRDAVRALRAAAVFSLAALILFPLGAAGTAGEPAIAQNPLTFYIPTLDQLVGGGATDLVVTLLVGSLVLVVLVAMADSSRALYGMSLDGMTVRGLDRLNRFGVPGRAITVDLLLNLGLLFFVGSVLAIVAAGNLGYVLAHVFALVAFLLLRRDRPAWARPVRLGRPLVVAIGALAAFLAFICVVGATSFELTGYGGRRELAIALTILLASVVLYVFRRVIQDGEPLRFREPGPLRTAPSGEEPG